MADFQTRQAGHLDQHTVAQQQGAGIVSQGLVNVGNQPHYQQQTDLHQQKMGGQQYAQNDEALEMQAFEKGRMQGEMEAMRRLEQDGALHQNKMMGAAPVAAVLAPRPDVLEINRMTWLQRLAFVLGELTSLTMIVLTLIFILSDTWRFDDGVTFTNERGNERVFNTFLLCEVIGLFLLGNAITNYRVFPLRTSVGFNKGWYIFLQLGAHTAFWLGFVAWIYSSPESRVWSVTHWVWLAAAVCFTLHGLYSIFRTLAGSAVAVTYEEWAEVNNRLTVRGAKAGDRTLANDSERTIYAPAPHFGASRGPAANANVGAEVPVAPANAPRWAENPHTHAEDYFLLPRSKWAVVGYWAMGAAFLMVLSGLQQNLASTGYTWSQDSPDRGYGNQPVLENGGTMAIIGAIGLMTIFSLIFLSYAAMPPRTTLVKNGILDERDINARRASISHNAETRNSMV